MCGVDFSGSSGSAVDMNGPPQIVVLGGEKYEVCQWVRDETYGVAPGLVSCGLINKSVTMAGSLTEGRAVL